MGKYTRRFLPHLSKKRTKPPKPPNTTYYQRNLLLKELGYVDRKGHASYFTYLLSPLWKVIRRKAFRIHGLHCKLCPRRAFLVHHISYSRETLLGTDPTLKELAPLCRTCHNKVELTPKGRKRKLISAQSMYAMLRLRRIKQLAALVTISTSTS